MQSEKTRIFIEKARAKHGLKFDYSQVVYVNARAKVIIKCPKHGVISQRAHSHLNTMHGCRECSIPLRALGNRETTESFISRAMAKHGNVYGYSKAKYTLGKNKLTINCRLHGDFEQIARSHLDGAGCPKCGNCLPISYAEFIDRAKCKHGDRYKYIESSYTGIKYEMEIVCATHGSFKQTAASHCAGRGCPSCAREETAKEQSGSTKGFIEDAKRVHGDLYCYKDVDYKSARVKVKIKCRTHGLFMQNPANHVHNKQGCPRCVFSKSQPTKVYLLTNGEQLKVGVSVDVKTRIYNLNLSSVFTSELITSWLVKDYTAALELESSIHKRLSSYKHSFPDKFDGSTEWFNLPPATAIDKIEQVIANAGATILEA